MSVLVFLWGIGATITIYEWDRIKIYSIWKRLKLLFLLNLPILLAANLIYLEMVK